MSSKISTKAIEKYLMPELVILKAILHGLNLYNSLQVLILLQSVLELELKEREIQKIDVNKGF